MNPFTSLSVQPSYGDRTVLVAWSVLPGFEDGLFYIYRSETGEAPWDLRNGVVDGVAVGAGGGSFEDDELTQDNRLTDTYYRMAVVLDDGSTFDSPVVRMLGQLSRREWGGACEIMRREHLRMSCGRNGIPVLHYMPLTAGDVSPMYDPDTGQHTGYECPDTSDPAYGMKYVGGFAPPIATYIEFPGVGPLVMADAADGFGNQDPLKVRARMLAHPAPRRGHMVVHTPSDNRYVVGPVVKGHYFRGIVALAFDVELHLLRRTDPRYRVPVPVELLEQV